MKKRNFEERLTGGHPNSLGDTVAVVEAVLKKPERFGELFDCYRSDDEVVRLRTSNAMKRIARENKALLVPYLDQLLNEVSKIPQPSVHWTLAQLFARLKEDMSGAQLRQAKKILKKSIAHASDWIVLNMTMDTLSEWAREDASLRRWLMPFLNGLQDDGRKSVSAKAQKSLAKLTKPSAKA
ncbi:MAG: hypothetical protein CL389_05080 [Acidiferrobacteraceae bacterium]|nr:hypothetical protein [Acidiferrobacteraceae bacterium]